MHKLTHTNLCTLLSSLLLAHSNDSSSLSFFLGRLKTDNAGGAWCPQKQLDASNSGSEWIQVDLGASHVITGVATQGRYGKGMGQEFTEAYRILYSRANAPDRWILWRSWDNLSVS